MTDSPAGQDDANRAGNRFTCAADDVKNRIEVNGDLPRQFAGEKSSDHASAYSPFFHQVICPSGARLRIRVESPSEK
jgi:hypothetical protein